MLAKPSSAEWTRVMSYVWQQRRAMIAQHIIGMLGELPEGEYLATRALIEKLWPEAECRGYDELKARNQFPAAVLKARAILEGWYTLVETGEEKFGKKMKRTHWHNKNTKTEPAAEPGDLGLAARVFALEDRCRRMEEKLQEYGVI